MQGHARRSPALGGHDWHASSRAACQDARGQAVPPLRLDLASRLRGAQAGRCFANFWRCPRPCPDERQAPRPRSPGGCCVSPRPADQGEDRVCPDRHQDPQAPGPQGGTSGDCEYCFFSARVRGTRLCHAYRQCFRLAEERHHRVPPAAPRERCLQKDRACVFRSGRDVRSALSSTTHLAGSLGAVVIIRCAGSLGHDVTHE